MTHGPITSTYTNNCPTSSRATGVCYSPSTPYNRSVPHRDNDHGTKIDHLLTAQNVYYDPRYNPPIDRYYYYYSTPWTRDYRRHSPGIHFPKYGIGGGFPRVAPNIDFVRYKFNIQAYCLDNRYSVTVSWQALRDDIAKITGDAYTPINFYANTLILGEITTGGHSFFYTPDDPDTRNKKEYIGGYINNKPLRGRQPSDWHVAPVIGYYKARPPTGTERYRAINRIITDNFTAEDIALHKQLYFDHGTGKFNVNNVILPIDRSLSSKITVTLRIPDSRNRGYFGGVTTNIIRSTATIIIERPHTKLNPCTARSGFHGWPTNSYIFNNYPLMTRTDYVPGDSVATFTYSGTYFCEMQKLIPPQEIPYHTGRRATEEIYHIEHTPDFMQTGADARYEYNDGNTPIEFFTAPMRKIYSLGTIE